VARAPKPGSPKPEHDVVILVDGERYPFTIKDMTALDVGALRRATNMTSTELFAAAAKPESRDIDVVAALVWLSRRQNGEPNLSYIDGVTGITHGTEMRFVESEPVQAEALVDQNPSL
jgi:hypothetical protein